jgi:hypothetical protein
LQRLQRGAHGDSVVGGLQKRIRCPEQVLALKAVRVTAVRTVERIGAVGGETGGRGENLLFRHVELRGDLSSRWEPAQPLSEIGASPGHL